MPTFVFPVMGLLVDVPWQVGPGLIRPSGELKERVLVRQASEVPSALVEQYRQHVLDEVEAMADIATARVDAEART